MADDKEKVDREEEEKNGGGREDAPPAADGIEKTVDEEWKTQAREEKEKLEQKVKEQAARRPDRDMPPADFLHFVSGMAAQALMQLGAIENPLERGRKTDLAAARYSIDCLQMLAEKTKGNLADEEDKYLRAALHDLRMRFVDAAGGPSAGASPGKGGTAG